MVNFAAAQELTVFPKDSSRNRHRSDQPDGRTQLGFSFYVYATHLLALSTAGFVGVKAAGRRAQHSDRASC
jgi:hypothetical protein